MSLRHVLALFGLALAASSVAAADVYPSRPVKMIVGYSAGGGSDLVARLAADQLSKKLGTPVVVENVPGAAQNIAAAQVGRAAPDGYTLFMSTPALTINPWMYKETGYNPTESFAPVALFAQSPNVLIVPTGLGAKNVNELVAILKARKDGNFSSAGVGTTHHLTAELFKQLTHLEHMEHIPYKGAGEAVSAVVAGDVQFTFVSLPSAKSLIGNDKVRMLGLTGAEKSRLLPNVPMLYEAGLPGMDIGPWYGLLMPAKTPKAIVDKVNAAINSPDEELTQKLAGAGADRLRRTPDYFTGFIRQDLQRWEKLLSKVKYTRE